MKYQVAFPILGAPIGGYADQTDRTRTARGTTPLHPPEDIDTDGQERNAAPVFEFLGNALGAQLETATKSPSDLAF